MRVNPTTVPAHRKSRETTTKPPEEEINCLAHHATEYYCE